MISPPSQIYPNVNVEILRNFGPQPISSRFIQSPSTTEFFQEMRLALCPVSGLVQLAETFPPEELRPRVPWITAFEPEAHLDDLTTRLATLPGLSGDSVVASRPRRLARSSASRRKLVATGSSVGRAAASWSSSPIEARVAPIARALVARPPARA